MRWPTNDELRALVPLPEGYFFERLERPGRGRRFAWPTTR